MIDSLFGNSVTEAVNTSTINDKVLVVYNTADSNNWLNYWFHDNDFNVDSLQEAAVWLKLVKGTPEFTYFEQIFPSVIVPSLYLIHRGQIQLIIHGNESDNWSKLINKLNELNPNKKLEIKNAQASDTTFQYTDSTSNQVQRTDIETSENPETHAEVTPEEGKRDGAPKRPKPSFKETVERTTQQIYQTEIQKERRHEMEERERIIKLVRADREERRSKQNEKDIPIDDKPINIEDNIKDRSKLHTEICVLQIKLTNAHTLKNTFSSKETLNDVRKWVDLNRTDGDRPYSFHRNVPRLTFSDSDELKSLEALELTPRSAIILKPLESSQNDIYVANVQQSSLFGKVYNGFQNWWGANNQPEDVSNVEASMLPNPRVQNLRHESEYSFNSPLHSPTRNNSDLNISSRSVSPNVHKFMNNDDLQKEDEEKQTYNGNAIKLEKKSDNNIEKKE